MRFEFLNDRSPFAVKREDVDALVDVIRGNTNGFYR